MNELQHIRYSKHATSRLSASLSKNDHILIAMTTEEFFDYAVSIKRLSGWQEKDIAVWLKHILFNQGSLSSTAKTIWDRYSDNLKSLGSYSPVLVDAYGLARLAVDLQKGGDVFSKFRVGSHAGRTYILISGYANLRNHLRSAIYWADNAKVVSMGIGKSGVTQAVKGGLIISIIFSVAFHAVDQCLNDRKTWHHFVAGITVDVVSALTGGAIAWSAVTTVMGASAMAAVGPIMLVVFVGAGITYLLDRLSSKYNLTERLAQLLLECEKRTREKTIDIQENITRGLNYESEDPLRFLYRLFGIPYYE